jgi:Tfp pilus assembly major pilin PilA
LTFGIFGWVWYFIQSSWVKKIDKRSNATVYFICGLALMLLVMPLSIYNALANNGQPSLGTSMVVLLLEVVMLVFMYCGFFSMAASIREEMPKRGLRPDIGGVTLFFFTALYLQGQLSWIARWKDTGQKTPLPPKGIFWGLLLVPIVLTGFLAAIAISQYQDYVIRSQVSEGSSLADGTKTAVAEYYNNYDAFPAENALAGLAAPASIAGKYVSSVEVRSDGTITTRFSGTPPQQADAKISGKALVFKGVVQEGAIEWACDSSAGTTIDNKYRPVVCRD